MYPQIEIFWITIYTFWLSLSFAFILFFWMLYKLSIKFGINTNFFLWNIFYFFISSFIFSRLFYVIAEWKDYKYIFNEWFLKFFFMSDYNFSLIWWIFGFLLILFIQIKKFKLNSNKFIDAVVLSFLFAWIIWYIWTFLWWQICWTPTDLPIWITSDSLSKCAYTMSTFPLSIIYTVIVFLLFVIFYILKIFIKTEWLIWYIWIIIFCLFLLIFENFNWNIDIFKSYFYLNINQIGSILLILLWIRWLIKIYKKEIM